MWSPDGSHEAGSEVGKMRFDIVPYMRGRCLDLGCGPTRAWPHFVGVDSGKDEHLFGVVMKPNLRADVTDLSMLASGEWDCVFSSHTLEHVQYEQVPETLAGWMRLLKVGGYLVLYLPDADEYPHCDRRGEWEQWHRKYGKRFATKDACAEELANLRRRKGAKKTGEIYAGTPWANPDHKWDVTYDKVLAAMPEGFDLLEFQKRNEGVEYSLFFVFRKTMGGRSLSWKNPKPEKTAAVCRYGAIGDCIMATSILPGLKAQGFHVTFYTGTTGEELLKYNPHIDRLIVQEKDAVPPQMLWEFWEHERKKYDRWVNLSESVEGKLLACPDRVEFRWPNEVRAALMDRNYLEHAHALAQVGGPYRTEFHASLEEREWARGVRPGPRNVLWSLAGSSGHKVWPHVDTVVMGILHQYPDVHVLLVGDESCQLLEQGWGKEPRVHCLSGKWTIRQSLAFCEVADLIIGTETGLMNAAGCMDVPKIITLSHSSEEMLTKHWRNVQVLRQPQGVGCPKQPCRQLHGGAGYDAWIDCPQEKEHGVALCQFHVTPDMMWQAVMRVLGVTMRRAA
ncbi:MAG: methyltransferase domain-containing protein [Armatimonadetes bacterium]|nr:methyltransferase domain-containing protein [Armatimonadota bacterium]